MPTRRLALVALATLAIAACSSPTAGPSGSPSPTSDPSPSPSQSEGIEHPTGPTDLVLRLEEGGGFVPMEFNAAAAPIFSLYGDGTIVFRDPAATGPEAGDGLFRLPGFKTAKLTEAKVQELLVFAVNEGGLGVARERYDNQMVADASTSTFFISAAGKEKKVEVYALGMDVPGGADEAIRRAFLQLADELKTFDSEGEYNSVDYQPAGYRGVLFESGGAPINMLDWPWPNLEPADFTAPAEGGFPRRAFTPAEIAELGIEQVEGGVQGLNFEGPDNKAYTFVIRPLLPDEEN
jgi:hypothetical protein